MWKPLADERAAKIALLEKRLMEEEESAPPPWPTERTITVILTVHGDKRLPMAKEAYRSILAAGFKADQIRICLTHPAGVGYGMTLSAFRDCACVDQLGPIDNNSAWLQSCERAESSHIIILHDDDLMKPGLADKLRERDDWEVAYWDADLIGDVQSSVRYFKCKPGVYNGQLVREVQSENELTISTIQGCFPRHIAIEAFSRFQGEFNQPEFQFRPGMWVGNDFLIWWLAGGSSKVWIVGESFSCCRGHTGSTTAIGLQDGRIAPMYGEMRRRLGAIPKRRVIFGHAFGEVGKFCRHFESFKTRHQVVFLCHSASQRIPSNSSRVIIPDSGLKIPRNPAVSVSNHASKFIFPQACKAALDGFDEMMWVETDCQFSGDNWDDVLRHEHSGAGDVVCSGTPVMWSTFYSKTKTAAAAIEYASNYHRLTGRVAAIEGTLNDSPCVFPNGALSWYSRELMDECFVARMKSGLEQFASGDQFDLECGRYIWSRFGENSFKKVGITPSSYSGCGDHWYSLNDRLQMLSSGKIVAVHQVKS
jgi:hypothetical protein